MQAFIINMDGASERWHFVSEAFRQTGIPYSRVAGVVGKALELPHPQYSGRQFRLKHGHRDNFGAIGCYFSHLKAIQAFLDSSDQIGIIAEDDADPAINLRQIIEAAEMHQPTWDVLRLCGFHDAHVQRYAPLVDEYHLAICFTRLCGTGCYAITRHAAQTLLDALDPMTLPIDHAIDKEWAYGLKAAAVDPLPVSQRAHQFVTQCGGSPSLKLPWMLRYWTVFPYRAWNETNRFFQRRKQLAAAKELMVQDRAA